MPVDDHVLAFEQFLSAALQRCDREIARLTAEIARQRDSWCDACDGTGERRGSVCPVCGGKGR